MKLVSLNIWGGRQGKQLLDYLKPLAKNTDIFCFQEMLSSYGPAPKVWHKSRLFLFQELSKKLANFTGIFIPRVFGFDVSSRLNFPVCQGLAVFVKNSVEILNSNSVVITGRAKTDHPSEGDFVAQTLVLKKAKEKFSVINFHGMSRPGNKFDTKRRLLQSKNLKNLWQSMAGPKILCGDFNLELKTKSIKILESVGKNLIKEFNIKNTRNEVSWQNNKNVQYFADFTFVSKEIKVRDFRVPYNLVSDHLPMELWFEIKNRP